MRVFLDTNVLVSATASRGLCADVFRTAIEFHELVVSEHLFEELKRVLRTKFDAPDDLITETIWLLHQDTIMAPTEPLASIPLRDPADIAIVSAALNGGAEILVTGDKEMIELKKVGALQIVTPRQFWERQKGQPRSPSYRRSRGSA